MEPTTPIPDPLKALTDEVVLMNAGSEQSPELTEKVNTLLLEALSNIQKLKPQTEESENSQKTPFEQMLSQIEQPVYFYGTEDIISINDQAYIGFVLRDGLLLAVISWGEDINREGLIGSSLSFQIGGANGSVIMERIAEIQEDGLGGGFSEIDLSEQDRDYIESTLRKAKNGHAVLRFALAPEGSEISVFGILQKELAAISQPMKDVRIAGGGETTTTFKNGGVIHYFPGKNGQLGVGIEYPSHNEIDALSVQIKVGEGEQRVEKVTELKKRGDSLLGSVSFSSDELDGLPPFSEITFQMV